MLNNKRHQSYETYIEKKSTDGGNGNSYLSFLCCFLQKQPVVLLLHSLSENEGDWSILPLLP